MEKVKEFFKSPKKTAILGLVGGFLMLLCNVLDFLSYENVFYIIGVGIVNLILQNILRIGITIYFSVILVRLYAKKGNIKVANYILLISLIIYIIVLIIYKNFVSAIIFTILAFYFFKILFNKNIPINNIVFTIVLVAYSILSVWAIIQQSNIINGYMYWVVIYGSYLLIIPYFYNYYELLKEEK